MKIKIEFTIEPEKDNGTVEEYKRWYEEGDWDFIDAIMNENVEVIIK